MGTFKRRKNGVKPLSVLIFIAALLCARHYSKQFINIIQFNRNTFIKPALTAPLNR